MIASFCLLIMVTPGSAANTSVNTIAPGGDVFIGEHGFNIRACVLNTIQVAWFDGAASLSNGTPGYVLNVGDPRLQPCLM